MLPYTTGLSNGPTRYSKSWNLCYANSVLQSIIPFVEEWARAVIQISSQEKHIVTQKSISSQGYEFAFLILTMMESSRPLDLRYFLGKLDNHKPKKFPIGQQADAHEFLIFLFETINEPVLLNYFIIYEQRAIQCTRCGHTLYQDEKLDSTRLQSKEISLFLDLTSASPKCDLDDLLLDLWKTEEVSYRCTYNGEHGCKSGKEGTALMNRRLLVPSYAVLVAIGRSNPKGFKNNNAVILHEQQTFLSYSKDPNSPAITVQKELKAVIMHKGKSVQNGHYFAFVKHPHTHQWWKYNDDRVTLSSFTSVIRNHRNSILLFFDNFYQ